MCLSAGRGATLASLLPQVKLLIGWTENNQGSGKINISSNSPSLVLRFNLNEEWVGLTSKVSTLPLMKGRGWYLKVSSVQIHCEWYAARAWIKKKYEKKKKKNDPKHEGKKEAGEALVVARSGSGSDSSSGSTSIIQWTPRPSLNSNHKGALSFLVGNNGGSNDEEDDDSAQGNSGGGGGGGTTMGVSQEQNGQLFVVLSCDDLTAALTLRSKMAYTTLPLNGENVDVKCLSSQGVEDDKVGKERGLF